MALAKRIGGKELIIKVKAFYHGVGWEAQRAPSKVWMVMVGCDRIAANALAATAQQIDGQPMVLRLQCLEVVTIGSL